MSSPFHNFDELAGAGEWVGCMEQGPDSLFPPGALRALGKRRVPPAALLSYPSRWHRHGFACPAAAGSSYPCAPTCHIHPHHTRQVFIPTAKPFLLRMAENRSLLAQPPAALLQHLQNPLDGAIPPLPWLATLRGAQPASLQTPGLPPMAGGGWPSPAPPSCWLGGGTPPRGAQLLSPGAWRISRGQMTPLASPCRGEWMCCQGWGLSEWRNDTHRSVFGDCTACF